METPFSQTVAGKIHELYRVYWISTNSKNKIHSAFRLNMLVPGDSFSDNSRKMARYHVYLQDLLNLDTDSFRKLSPKMTPEQKKKTNDLCDEIEALVKQEIDLHGPLVYEHSQKEGVVPPMSYEEFLRVVKGGEQAMANARVKYFRDMEDFRDVPDHFIVTYLNGGFSNVDEAYQFCSLLPGFKNMPEEKVKLHIQANIEKFIKKR